MPSQRRCGGNRRVTDPIGVTCGPPATADRRRSVERQTDAGAAVFETMRVAWVCIFSKES